MQTTTLLCCTGRTVADEIDSHLHTPESTQARSFFKIGTDIHSRIRLRNILCASELVLPIVRVQRQFVSHVYLLVRVLTRLCYIRLTDASSTCV